MLIIVYCVAITLGLCLYWILHTEQARRFLVIHHNDCDHLHNRVPRDEAQAPLLNSPQGSPSNCASAANSPCSVQQGAVTREVVLSDSRLVGQITRHPSPPAVPSMRRLTIRTQHPSASATGATTPTSSQARYPSMGDQARSGSYRPARLFRSNSGSGGTLVTPNGVTVLQQVPTQNEYTWPTDDEDDDDDDAEDDEEAIDEDYELTTEYVDEFHESPNQNYHHHHHQPHHQHRSSQRVNELQKAAQHLNRPRAIRPPPGRWGRKRPRTRETYVPLTSFSQRFQSQDDETSTSGDATTTLAGAAATMIQIEAC